jgi:hypothetical protein
MIPYKSNPVVSEEADSRWSGYIHGTRETCTTLSAYTYVGSLELLGLLQARKKRITVLRILILKNSPHFVTSLQETFPIINMIGNVGA